jgi:hypothetical protein
MSYDSNLSLPVCPKCRETKGVIRGDEHSTTLTISTYFAYTCILCEIFWDSQGFISEGKK